MKAGALTDERVQRLREILAANPGDSPVLLTLIGPDKETDLRLGDEFRCDARNGLFAELRILFGAECIGSGSARSPAAVGRATHAGARLGVRV